MVRDVSRTRWECPLKFRAGGSSRAKGNSKGHFPGEIVESRNSVQRQVKREQLCMCLYLQIQGKPGGVGWCGHFLEQRQEVQNCTQQHATLNLFLGQFLIHPSFDVQ